MKQFSIPFTYRSPLISRLKEKRKEGDKLKKDFSPTYLKFGPIEFYLARHFGFCYGVENAIEIAFNTLHENPDKRIFLLGEMIHNPLVNQDLLDKGVKFLQDTKGNILFPLEELTKEDIVIIPAFGTTIEMEAKLRNIGIQIEKYDTTCPFVEKVWKRSEQISKNNYTIIVHGKPSHEETKATFSHAAKNSPTLIINDLEDAVLLSNFIKGLLPLELFYNKFNGRYSEGFNAEKDLVRIGVVNQTTMLASDTQSISDFLKKVMTEKYQLNQDNIHLHFADTRDTLCYATNDNQTSVQHMLQQEADFALVIGGYNSSNTSHLVELCETQLPTYFINHPDRIISKDKIEHFDFHQKTEKTTDSFLTSKQNIKILLSSGASCPDALVEKIIEKIALFFVSREEYENVVKSI